MNWVRERWLPLALVALAMAIAMVHAPHGPTLGSDDHGQYLMHAKALVEGRPYVDIGFLHTPWSTLVGPIAEPPGLPVLAAGMFKLGGMRAEAARTILFVSFACFGLLAWAYFKQLTSAGTAAVVTAWTLVAFGREHVLDTMLADLPFIVALWAVCLLADQGPVRGGRRLALLALAGAAAFTFRMAALPLLPAAATALLLRPSNERRGFLLLGIAWTIAAALVMFGLPTAEVLGSETVRSPTVLWRDFALNARDALDGARRFVPLRLPQREANIALQLAVLGVVAVGAVVGCRDRHRRVAWITAAWYLVMLATLPTRAPRYLWPLYPLLALAAVEGSTWLLRPLAQRLRRPADHLARALAAACVAIGLWRDATAPVPPTYARLADVSAMRAALAREDGGTHRLRVVSFAPRVMAWEDGFTTMAGFDTDPDEMLRVMRQAGITHVVRGDPSGVAIGMDGVAALVAARPEAFEKRWGNATFLVLALIPPPP